MSVAFINAAALGASINIPPDGLQPSLNNLVSSEIPPADSLYVVALKEPVHETNDPALIAPNLAPFFDKRGPALAAKIKDAFKSPGDSGLIYTGLLTGGTAAKPISGLARVVVNARGAFTASIRIGGTASVHKGTFGADGSTVNLSLPAGLILGLHFASGEKKITGTLTSQEGPETHPQMLPAGFNKHTLFESPGKYTIDFSSVVPAGVKAPNGEGAAVIQATKTGAVRFAGSLADGTKVAMGGVIASDRTFPIHIPLYRGGGFFAGLEAFQAGGAAGSISGINHWLRPANPHDRLYPAGFLLNIAVHGSL